MDIVNEAITKETRAIIVEVIYMEAIAKKIRSIHN